MHRPVFTLACFLMAHACSTAAELPDLAAVDRSLRKEPTYVSKRPQYGLAVFGKGAEARVWLVLDQSKPDAAGYDVLHVDRNADGDLTGPGERLTPDSDGRFRIPEFKDPATGVQHRDFNLRFLDRAGPTVMVSLLWRGEFKLGGGYPQDPETGYLRFAPTREQAPVLWLCGDTPFRFQRWTGGKLTIGAADDLRVFLGQPGRGPSTFCAAQQHILPDKDWVRATLIYHDGMGKEQRAVCELKDRC